MEQLKLIIRVPVVKPSVEIFKRAEKNPTIRSRDDRNARIGLVYFFNRWVIFKRKTVKKFDFCRHFFYPFFVVFHVDHFFILYARIIYYFYYLVNREFNFFLIFFRQAFLDTLRKLNQDN